MSRNPSALASLTANYTDSENEDGHDSDENSPQTEESAESQVRSIAWFRLCWMFNRHLRNRILAVYRPVFIFVLSVAELRLYFRHHQSQRRP